MRVGLIAVVAAMSAAASPLALAQEAYQPPRTPDGHPDFGGVWSTTFMTSLSRPGFHKTLVISEEEALKGVEIFGSAAPDLVDPDFHTHRATGALKVRGEYRSSLLVLPENGKMPLSEKAKKLAEHLDWMDSEAHDHPEERPTFDRCLAGSGQPPIRPFTQALVNLFVQTPDALVIMTEDVAGLRVVHLDGRAPPPAVLTAHGGWSTGRWEGDTLVVETTHVRAEDSTRPVFGGTILFEPDSKLIERFTRVSPTELVYQFTVEDADLYTAPWLAEYSFTLDDTQFYEFACHEANYSMVNILLGGRVQARRDREDRTTRMRTSADRAGEREDLGEAQDVGHQQDHEDREDHAQHVAAGRGLRDTTVQRADLVIGHRVHARLGVGRVHAFLDHRLAHVLAGEEGIDAHAAVGGGAGGRVLLHQGVGGHDLGAGVHRQRHQGAGDDQRRGDRALGQRGAGGVLAGGLWVHERT